MMMDKFGVIIPGVTPDVEDNRDKKKDKTAEQLDQELRRKVAATAESKLTSGQKADKKK